MTTRRSPITTHVLDLSHGKPAVGVPVTLERRDSTQDEWSLLKRSATDADGRVGDLMDSSTKAHPGVYRLTFETAAYFRDERTFYPYAQIVFTIDDSTAHYHVPLLLSPFGYSTYRGT